MSEPIATRDAYGKALARMGETHPEIVVLDADLSKSTKTNVFAKKFPERFFEMGISESDMMCTAAGFATCGKLPFASSFAVFASRAWEPIRTVICRGRLPVRMCLTHAGVSVGEDGASAQANEDIAIFRALPHMDVIVPADGVETESVIEYLVEHRDGPAMVRLGRAKCPIILPENYRFELGKGIVLRPGDDVAIVACGLMVAETLTAAEQLAADGISARVINLASIKPIDEDLLVAAASETRGIVTAEEHSIIGGLGGAVSEVLGERHPTRIRRVGMPDCFGESGSSAELLQKYGQTAADIVRAAKELA